MLLELIINDTSFFYVDTSYRQELRSPEGISKYYNLGCEKIGIEPSYILKVARLPMDKYDLIYEKTKVVIKDLTSKLDKDKTHVVLKLKDIADLYMAILSYGLGGEPLH